MARHPFGLTPQDWTFVGETVDAVDNVVVAASATLTFWNAATAGTQLTDLALDADGLTPVSTVTTSDGTDGNPVGSFPAQVYGPDGTTEMWVSADGGPRALMVATDAAAIAQETQTALASHAAAANAHGTGFGDLTDVEIDPPVSRVDGTVATWDAAASKMRLLTPAAVAGAVLLNPPLVGGTYVGQEATENPPALGSSGVPWLLIKRSYSSGDTNPDLIQIKAFWSDLITLLKTWWLNGNGEMRGAPSTPSRIGGRFFESYEAVGLSTGRFFELSSNPTNSANREPFLGAYGSSSSTKPGWVEATRILSALQGVAAGGNYPAGALLSQLIFRGRRTSTGAPTAGSYQTGDIIIDANGVVYLCTSGGTPGTWIGGASTWTDVPSLGTNVSHGTPHCQYRLEGADIVRLKGQLVYAGAVGTLFTLPAGFHPPAAVVLSERVRTASAAGNDILVSTGGVVTTSTAGTNTQTQNFDGLTFTTT